MNKMVRSIFLVILFSHQVGLVLAKTEGGREIAGDILQIALPVAACSTTFILGDHEGSKQFFQSFLTCFAVTHVLKYAVNKPRQENNGNYSFPSGHTASAFQGASFIHLRYGFKSSIPAYIAAGYVGWSRVEGESDKHDIWDVVAGAAIGAGSCFLFTTRYENVQVVPVADGRNIGINVSWKW